MHHNNDEAGKEMTKMKVIMSLLMMACLVTWLVGTSSDAGSVTPGSVNDPIVTKSYVDQKDGEVLAELEERLLALEAAGGTTSQSTAAPVIEGDVDMDAIYAYIDQKLAEGTSGQGASNGLFTVVEATKGQRVVCGASAEIILRAGSGTVIAGEQGDGLANLTTGVDLRGGDIVPLQNHLLVSRDDGRGVLIDSEGTSYLLIKGAYTID